MAIPTNTWAVTLCVLLVLGALPAYAQDPAAAPPPSPTDSSAAAAVLHLRALAETRGTGGRFAGGFASGLLLGLIGTGIVYAIAGSDDTSIPALEATRLSTASPTYSLAFQQGYSERLKSRRRSSALTGGLLGTLTVVVIYVSATSGN
jgi:hypothetical protein